MLRAAQERRVAAQLAEVSTDVDAGADAVRQQLEEASSRRVALAGACDAAASTLNQLCIQLAPHATDNAKSESRLERIAARVEETQSRIETASGAAWATPAGTVTSRLMRQGLEVTAAADDELQRLAVRWAGRRDAVAAAEEAEATAAALAAVLQRQGWASPPAVAVAAAAAAIPETEVSANEVDLSLPVCSSGDDWGSDGGTEAGGGAVDAATALAAAAAVTDAMAAEKAVAATSAVDGEALLEALAAAAAAWRSGAAAAEQRGGRKSRMRALLDEQLSEESKATAEAEAAAAAAVVMARAVAPGREATAAVAAGATRLEELRLSFTGPAGAPARGPQAFGPKGVVLEASATIPTDSAWRAAAAAKMVAEIATEEDRRTRADAFAASGSQDSFSDQASTSGLNDNAGGSVGGDGGGDALRAAADMVPPRNWQAPDASASSAGGSGADDGGSGAPRWASVSAAVEVEIVDAMVVTDTQAASGARDASVPASGIAVAAAAPGVVGDCDAALEVEVVAMVAGDAGVVDLDGDAVKEVPDEQREATRAAFKVLDVAFLLAEKALLVGLPSALAAAGTASRRLSALARAGGGPGWRLLRQVKRRSGDDD
ncbi:unnamed protein product [Phaeothamnion confervicola]